ncbi:MAG TPA: hypothetical protein VGR61_08615, partial [Candidatus Dormibacteraeota bacterium]|nr:hypothetical protein [Candidatus Dormibacteraeota bacterium]
SCTYSTPTDPRRDSTPVLAAAAPPDTAPIEELAAYWAAHQDQLRDFSSWLYRVRRRLTDAVKDGGPIITPAGRLGLEAAGYEYPPEIAQEFPGLGHHVVTAVVDTVDQAERILDLVTEEVPTAEVSHELRVDGRAASRLIHQGGAAAKRLLDLRVAKGRLAVK